MLNLYYNALEELKAAVDSGVLYFLIPLFSIMITILIPAIYPPLALLLSKGMAALKACIAYFANTKTDKGKVYDSLSEEIEAAGYNYDPNQDIFYSTMNPWQRDLGYCRLYDEAAAPLGMIIDCEPIYFKYDNKRWMIELWKGQYDLTTGCEIGVYTTQEPDINVPGVFKGTFYYCASDTDLLNMSYTLNKNGKAFFTRKDNHWWLTGFKLGEFSEPSELTMDINISLKDKLMLHVFVEGLRNAGYSDNEIIQNGNTVSFKFDKTRTVQPATRSKETDRFIQTKNEYMCNAYQDITHEFDNLPDKFKAIQEKAPKMYETIINIGKNKQLYAAYEIIKIYLKH